MLQVARSTVIGALDRLVAAGLVVRRQGSGTYIVHGPGVNVPPGFEVLMSPREVAMLDGVETGILSIHVSTDDAPPEDIARTLEVATGTPLQHVTRIAGHAGTPHAVLDGYVAPRAGLGDEDDLALTIRDEGSLLGALLTLPSPVASAETRISAITVDVDDPALYLLGAEPGTAALEIVETYFCPEAYPIAYSRDVIAHDGWALTMRRTVSAGRAAPPAPLPPRGQGRGRPAGR